MIGSDCIKIEHSEGFERRANALGVYLNDLFSALVQDLNVVMLEHHVAPIVFVPVTLRVLHENDWARNLPYAYGFTFYRRLKTGQGLIFAPTDYPPRLQWTLKTIMMQAEQAQIKAPGQLTEFLDFTLGHELGHALAEQLGLRTHVRWLDEFLATYLYLAALRRVMPDAYRRVIDWGYVFSSGSVHCDVRDNNLLNRNVLSDDANLLVPSGNQKRKAQKRQARFDDVHLQRTDLGAFEYPFLRLSLANQVWYQAKFTLRAAELLERHGLEFIVEAVQVLPQLSKRGDLTRSLMRLEPSFKPWFAHFGHATFETGFSKVASVM